jgi:transposase
VDIKTVVELYTIKKLSIRNIAKMFDEWPYVITNALKEAGVTLLPKGRRKGTPAYNKGKPSPKRKNNTEFIESGEYKKLGEATARSRVKKYLLEKHGHVCSICKNTEWNGKPIPLVCDHIDGNSSNPELSNFRLVCCNCDAQLPTYKSKNRGNGRTYDRKYYNDRTQMVV